MKDDVHAVRRALGDRRVAEIAEEELVPPLELAEVRPVTGREVVDDPHLVPEGDEARGDVRADEAGTAGDETAQAPLPSVA